MPKTEWIIKDKSKKTTSLLKKLLAIRGITKASDVKDFLNPLSMDLTSPDVFSDMKKAVKRIDEAIKSNENILIYGDFDADGITSTSILYKTFKELKANIFYYIPNREVDGHGLNTKPLVNLMTKIKPKLVITVDCGISNVEEVNFLKSFKIDCIITDHHEAPETLPSANAIINPKAPNALSDELSTKQIEYLTSLAGCGVAFKLAQALLTHFEKTAFLTTLFPYVAVGTVADLVPLIGENRYLVQKGINLIIKGEHYGLKRLLEINGYSESITSENIAFTIAPRINACGRLDSVEEAMKLMISDNKQEIEMAIISLNNYNKIRQDMCDATFLQAKEMLENEGNKNNAIILYNKDWHIGIIGIVASKIVGTYHKPTFLMTYSEETKQIRCSARSVKGFHLYDTICGIEELLDGFGGHEMAAGLSFDPQKTSFEIVKNSLLQIIDETVKSKEIMPTLDIDMELMPDEINPELVSEISKLEPFGASNETPVFCINNTVLKQKQLMGTNKNHLRLTVEKENKQFTCIWWNHGDISLIENDTLDVAFSPQLNTYRGETSIQLIIKDLQSEYLTEIEPEETDEFKVFDHRKKTDILTQVDDYCKNSKLDIVIFAEDKNVLNILKPYKALNERIVNTNTLKKADSVMFFDYPSDEESYNLILEKTEPKHIHYMHYEPLPLDEKELIKNINGMIKFTINNKEGLFNLNSAASFLAISKNDIINILEVFKETDLIKITNKTDVEFKIESGKSTDVTLVLHNSKYKEFQESIKNTQEFKKKLYETVGDVA